MIRDHARLALVLLALAVAIKALVPAGFMLSSGADRFITVTICADASGAPQQLRLAVPSRHDGRNVPPNAASKAEPCAFTGLGASGLTGADPVLLAAALVFILLAGLGLLPALPLRETPFLRPHLRAPPAIL